MNWSDINVFQYQQLYKLFNEKDSITDDEFILRLAAISTNRTENEVKSLPFHQYEKIVEGLGFINEQIPSVTVSRIKVNGKVYRCIYDVRNMPAARYIESKHYALDVIPNLHKLMATMVMPQRKGWMGWTDDKYNAALHSQYADDFLQAKITEVLGSVVFFYQIFRNWIRSSQGYLIREMVKTGMTMDEAILGYISLCDIMDGFIKPNWLPNTSESAWKKRLKSLL